MAALFNIPVSVPAECDKQASPRAPNSMWPPKLLEPAIGQTISQAFNLKLTFRQYPAIHTNYIISHCNKILNTKDIEFNSVAISVLCHEPPMLCRGQINVAGIRR